MSITMGGATPIEVAEEGVGKAYRLKKPRYDFVIPSTR